jgi:hypothetical protein
MKGVSMKKTIKKVTATAKCASFDIEMTATITGKGLVKSELEDVQRKLRHKITTTIADLPFAHVYPNEVRVR